MNHVSLSLTNRKFSVHLHSLNYLCTALRTFTPRRDQLVICGQCHEPGHFHIENFQCHLNQQHMAAVNICNVKTMVTRTSNFIQWKIFRNMPLLLTTCSRDLEKLTVTHIVKNCLLQNPPPPSLQTVFIPQLDSILRQPNPTHALFL
jgi:hypothetical protein